MILVNFDLNFVNLFMTLPGGIAQGILWGIMALGLYITFRLLDVADLSVDGTFTLGGAVCVMLITNGMNPWLAILIAFISGILAGTVTGVLHTKLGIPAILAGILTQFSLYSINLAIMTFKSNIAVSVDKYQVILSSRYIPLSILFGFILACILICLMYWYFGTENGSAMRATGCNPEMAKAQGININTMKMIGLALSNGIVAFSGGLMAQYQGFSDIKMGQGAIVIGLASIIIGEVLCNGLFKKATNFALKLFFIVIGGILYYFVIVIVLWLKLDPNLLKLFTAIIVTIFLAVPNMQELSKSSFRRAGKNSMKEI